MRGRIHPSGSSFPEAKRLGALAAMAMVVAVAFRHALTQTMALHMLVHIPLVVAAGVLAAMALRARGRPPAGNPPAPFTRLPHSTGLPRSTGQMRMAGVLAAVRRFDEYGVPGLLLVSFAGAFWMIPRTLDYVLVSPFANCLKFATLFAVGLVLCDALSRANTIIRLFFLGNFCWMLAVVGIVYQSVPNRLCNFYLASDQRAAGIALVALAVCLPVVWLYGAREQVRRFLRNA